MRTPGRAWRALAAAGHMPRRRNRRYGRAMHRARRKHAIRLVASVMGWPGPLAKPVHLLIGKVSLYVMDEPYSSRWGDRRDAVEFIIDHPMLNANFYRRST